MFHDHSIFACFTEHIDILALLDLICHIKDRCLFRLFLIIRSFFFLLFCFFCIFSLLFNILIFFIFFNAVLQCKIFSVNILEQNVIMHFICKFIILNAAKFNKWTNIVPVFLIGFSVCLTHTSQFVCNLFGNIFRNFLYKSIILKC